jgi:hypothetical protein
MKVIKWTGQVQDRLKWKGAVERGKTVRSCSAIEGEEVMLLHGNELGKVYQIGP